MRDTVEFETIYFVFSRLKTNKYLPKKSQLEDEIFLQMKCSLFRGHVFCFGGEGEDVLIYLRLQLSSMTRTSTSNPAGEVLAVAGLTSCILEAADDARKTRLPNVVDAFHTVDG